MGGWLKLYRDLLDKPIWIESTPEQKSVLITVLMMANHQEKDWEWQGRPYKVSPGQFITSLESIAKNCGKGVSIQNIRTSLKRFEKYGFLTSKSTNRNRLITLTNWEFYQSNEDEPTKGLTSNQQTLNKQLTTNKKERMIKKERNIKDFTSQIKNLLSRYPEGFIDLNKAYWSMIRETRKSKRISESVYFSTMEKWSHFSVNVVEYALKKHLEIGGDKDEKYTVGIMRRTTNEEAIDKLDRVSTKGVNQRETDQYDNLF